MEVVRRNADSAAGVSDIFGSVHQRADVVGRGPMDFAVFLAVEGKGPADRPTEEQAKFLVEIRRVGGIVIVACSVDELEAEVMPYLVGG